MALTVSISVSQNNGLPSQFTITDTSTGSDPTITSRRVYIYKADNTTLVPSGTVTSYIEWPIADGPLTIDVLTRDFAVELVVQWLDGATVVYTYENQYQFPAHTKTFLFGLSTYQTTQVLNPNILTATNFFLNKATLWCLVKDAENAISYAGDIEKAQIAFDMAYTMIINEDKFF